ncbi:MAG: hypothetical protein HWE23_01250 [Rhodobacteraceae bacterium]|nr:hypothetical protein [Paracoccaceae bacterium]
MGNELSTICDVLHETLQATLDEWARALDDADRSGEGDAFKLYNVYPKLVSQLAESRSSMNGAESASRFLERDYEGSSHVSGHGSIHQQAPTTVCPCCGESILKPSVSATGGSHPAGQMAPTGSMPQSSSPREVDNTQEDSDDTTNGPNSYKR